MRSLIEVEGLFDGIRTVGNAAIVIEGDTVAWVGKRSRIPKAPAGTRTREIAAPGRFALPGLVNCHSHLTLDGAADFSVEARARGSMQAFKALRNAREELAAGVTLVRDLGANSDAVIKLSRAIEAGIVEGPRVIACGRAITTTGGHGFEVGRMADGADDLRRAVREQLMSGARVIKLISTGGVLGEGAGPEVSQFTAEETGAAIEEGHKAAVRVTTHAHAAEGIRIAAEHGVDSIEHATFLDAKIVRMLVERDIAIVPTMASLAAIIANGDRLPPHIMERARTVAQRHSESVRLAHKAGVRIATGTDAGTPFNRHGQFANELDLLHGAGLSIEQTLSAATRIAADVCGMPRAGRIEAGSWADVVFVGSDPLRDLAPLHEPRGVWVRGAPVSMVGAAPEG